MQILQCWGIGSQKKEINSWVIPECNTISFLLQDRRCGNYSRRICLFHSNPECSSISGGDVVSKADLAKVDNPRSQYRFPLGAVATSLNVHLVRVFFQVGQLSPNSPVQNAQVGQPHSHVLYKLL